MTIFATIALLCLSLVFFRIYRPKSLLAFLASSRKSLLSQAHRLHPYFLFKVFFDRLFAVLLIVLLAPLLSLLYFLTLYNSGRPAFFFQERSGMYGAPFTLCKFRTMSSLVGEDGLPLSDEARLTPFGSWLRSTSLDELPSIFNILCGDMSFIGPRPLPTQYLDLYSSDQARRHDVMPGLTGWAQINGRNLLSWEEKFLLDLWYVDHQCLWLDLRIFIVTILKVLIREGVSPPGAATPRPFTGSARSE